MSPGVDIVAIGGSQPNELAMEEWRQLQMVIGRVERQEFQVRSWLLILLGALLAALYSEKAKLSGPAFAAVSAGLIVCLAYVELVARVVKRKAMNRSYDVERALRGACAYDGPRLGESLSSAWDLQTLVPLMFHEARINTVWGFYLPVWVIVLVLSTGTH